MVADTIGLSTLATTQRDGYFHPDLYMMVSILEVQLFTVGSQPDKVLSFGSMAALGF